MLLTQPTLLPFSWQGETAASSVGAGLGQRALTWQAWHARTCSRLASGDLFDQWPTLQLDGGYHKTQCGLAAGP